MLRENPPLAVAIAVALLCGLAFCTGYIVRENRRMKVPPPPGPQYDAILPRMSAGGITEINFDAYGDDNDSPPLFTHGDTPEGSAILPLPPGESPPSESDGYIAPNDGSAALDDESIPEETEITEINDDEVNYRPDFVDYEDSYEDEYEYENEDNLGGELPSTELTGEPLPDLETLQEILETQRLIVFALAFIIAIFIVVVIIKSIYPLFAGF